MRFYRASTAGFRIIRLIGAVLLEQNDEWQLQHRYMQVEAMAELTAPAGDPETRQIPCAA
jgi:putative transposase